MAFVFPAKYSEKSKLCVALLLLESAPRPPCPTLSACVSENEDITSPRYGWGESFYWRVRESAASDNWKNLDWTLPWEERERRGKRTKRTGWAKEWEEPREKDESREPRECVVKITGLYRKEKLGKGTEAPRLEKFLSVCGGGEV